MGDSVLITFPSTEGGKGGGEPGSTRGKDEVLQNIGGIEADSRRVAKSAPGDYI